MSPDSMQKMTEEFFREGSVVIPNMISKEEVTAFRALVDKYAASVEPNSKHFSHHGNTFVLRKCEELDPAFQNILTRDSIITVVEAVLGTGAKFNAMNVIRNGPGQAISNWHVDDVLEIPLPAEIPRFDPRMRMPVFWMTVQVALSDIDSLEHGPTQFVPGSHYSGRLPNSKENPTFEGRGAESVLCKAGDIYLTNHQCWHRGAPNVSDRTRYVMQLQYAQGWAAARFKGES